MNRLLIVQPYVPQYRSPLFSKLRELLASQDIDLRVAAGSPMARDAARDDAEPEQIDFHLRQRSVSFGTRTLQYRRVSEAIRQFSPDLLIAEQAVKNVETLLQLFPPVQRRTPRVGLWGHGKVYGEGHTGTMATWVKNQMSLRADWFFVYAREGAKFLEDLGYPASRLTVVMNSIDTTRLRSDFEVITETEVEVFRREFGLQPGKTGIFIGGVDARKGIGFLLEAAKEVEARCQGFKLLVAGAGAEVDRVLAAEKQGLPVRYLGRLDGERKALALKASDVLLVPEWVGLVAVDSLAVGRPIVTTDHPSHCPEFEYLSHDRNALVTPHDISCFADGITRLLEDVERLRCLQASACLDGSSLSIETMAARFTEGVLEWSRAGPKG